MQRRDRCVGVAGDDGDRVDLLTLPVAPTLPDARKGDQTALQRTKQERPPLALWPGPLIEAVRRHEAAPLGEGAAERALGGDAFAARIDHWRPSLRVPDEGAATGPSASCG